MSQENFPYRKPDSQPKSTDWQLSRAVHFVVFDDGESSLHFSWDRRDSSAVKKSGRVEVQDVRDSLAEIVNAVESFTKLVERNEFTAPNILIINTPTLMLQRLFPPEYITTERFGQKMFIIDIHKYMKENQLSEKKSAWKHFMENRILPNLLQMQERMKIAEKT